MATKTKPVQEYGADQLQKLDPMDHIRKRVSMYLGDNTGEGGMSVGLREIIDNAQDEFLNGHGSTIKLNFFEDGSAEVEDTGRGVPTGINRSTGENGVVLAFAHVGAGGKFGVEGNGYSGGAGGLNGVGASATQATSARFDVTVYRDGKEYFMSFSKGKPGFWDKPNDPTAKFTENRKIKVGPDKRSAAEKKARPTGTTIRVWPDADIFVPGAKYDVEGIKFRLKSTAFLLPGLHIEVNDLRDPANPVHDVYDFDGGVKDMIETVAPDKSLIKEPVYFQTKSSFTETASILDNDGKMTTGEVERPVDIDVAFTYGEGYDTTMKSFVNIINTKNGGTHETGFYQAMRRVWVNQIKNTRGVLKAKEEPPTLDDVKEGLTAIVSIKFPEPQFVGQEKATLGTSAITSVLSQAVGAELESFIANKKNAATVKMIMAKIVEASRIRLSQRAQKELARRKTSLESASMPAKLVDCAETSTEFAELHICEGDSALGTMREARDERYQALFPIRGKILNTHRATPAKMLDNAECAAIIQVLGAGSGRNFDIEQMRYKNICIAVDADLDGNHIRCLLIVFVMRYMRPVIEAGRLYATVPPLYVLKTTGRNKQIHYLSTDEEKDALLKKFEATGVKHEPLMRLKGLGEMDAEEFWDTTLNPETRKLRRITLDDVKAAEDMLDLTMGGDANARKQWMEETARVIRMDSELE